MAPPQLPTVRLGRETCGDPAAATRREWIATNGLGGYATAAIDGSPVRRYSGWLVAALEPPVARTVLVGALLETVAVGGQSYALASLARAGRGRDPDGGRHLEAFELEGMRPTWRFAAGGAVVEKRAWMAHGANTTYVRYRVVRGGPVTLTVEPLVVHRDHHDLNPMDERRPAVGAVAGGLEARWEGRATVLSLLGPGAAAMPQPDGTDRGWVRGIALPVETGRGLDDVADLAVAGSFAVRLADGDGWTLVLTVEDRATVDLDGERALAAARARDAELLARAGVGPAADPAVRQLVLAADQFVVGRPVRGEATPGRSVIAGYPWFNDWGRDTMIALPGLTLATGRPDDAARILRSYAPFVRDGLLPNSFPDAERAEPWYHTVDAALWYVHAVRAYLAATGDAALIDDLLPTLRAILDRYHGGTRFGIAVDPADGLVRAGVPGVQLTWMDARADDWVVTPRIGKPVEIEGLWVHACRTVAAWCAERGLDDAAARYRGWGDTAAASFRARFFRAELGWCADVLDGPSGDELRLRPNQLLALALEPDLLERKALRSVVDACARELLVGGALRSLAPSDPGYLGAYRGDRITRDAAYHQGTAWTWLLGPFVDAARAAGWSEAALADVVEPVRDHLREAGLGTVSECLEGDPPHRPVGCHAQAWGVAEALRALRSVGAG